MTACSRSAAGRQVVDAEAGEVALMELAIEPICRQPSSFSMPGRGPHLALTIYNLIRPAREAQAQILT